MKEEEDIYMGVVERIRLMALMILLHFDEIQAMKTRPYQSWVNVSDLYASWSKDGVGLIIHKNDKKS